MLPCCRSLGEGGFGSVRVVRSKATGVEFACKSICKRLDVPNLPPIKQQQHLENIQREVLILCKLRGTLNVVHLEVRAAAMHSTNWQHDHWCTGVGVVASLDSGTPGAPCITHVR